MQEAAQEREKDWSCVPHFGVAGSSLGLPACVWNALPCLRKPIWFYTRGTRNSLESCPVCVGMGGWGSSFLVVLEARGAFKTEEQKKIPAGSGLSSPASRTPQWPTNASGST